MRRLILLILFFNIYSLSYNQVINGSVFEKNTNSVVMFASIYFNGTTIGTTSNQDGYFELDVSKGGNMSLTISAIGYYSTTIREYSPDQDLIIHLKPKVFNLKEVVIKNKSLVRLRKRNLRLFKQEFLGTTSSRQCEILNESDIRFDYSCIKDTLKVYASKPILIHNKTLGYKITYFLDKFEYYKKDSTFAYKGDIRFKEDSIVNESNRTTYDKRRKIAYLGSKMHFFRALWLDLLPSAGFSVYNSERRELTYKDLISHDENRNKFLDYPDKIKIIYYMKSSNLIFLKKKIYFNYMGQYDPQGVFWEGELAIQRISSLLPVEYIPIYYIR